MGDGAYMHNVFLSWS